MSSKPTINSPKDNNFSPLCFMLNKACADPWISFDSYSSVSVRGETGKVQWVSFRVVLVSSYRLGFIQDSAIFSHLDYFSGLIVSPCLQASPLQCTHHTEQAI